MRAWLTAHGWTACPPGPAGSAWTPPGGGQAVGVPHDDADKMLTHGAVARIAEREGREPGEVRAEMMGMEKPGD